MRALFASESSLRESVVRHFCETFGHGEEYLNPANYSDGTDGVRTPSGVSRFLSSRERLISKILTPISQQSSNGSSNRRGFQPVVHYREQYGYVPLWVASLKLTFGQVCYLFGHQKLVVQQRVCQDLREQYQHEWDVDSNIFNPGTLDEYYSFLRELRNVCAHDERCFSYTVSVRGKKRDVASIAGLLKFFVRRSDYISMGDSVDASLRDLESELPRWAYSQVVDSVRVKKL